MNILVTTQYINRYLSLDKYTKVNVKSIHSSECNVIDSVVEVKVSKMITPQYKSEWLSRRNRGLVLLEIYLNGFRGETNI